MITAESFNFIIALTKVMLDNNIIDKKDIINNYREVAQLIKEYEYYDSAMQKAIEFLGLNTKDFE